MPYGFTYPAGGAGKQCLHLSNIQDIAAFLIVYMIFILYRVSENLKRDPAEAGRIILRTWDKNPGRNGADAYTLQTCSHFATIRFLQQPLQLVFFTDRPFRSAHFPIIFLVSSPSSGNGELFEEDGGDRAA